MKLQKITKIRYLKNKRVLVRCGYDVPLKQGKIKDSSRIKDSIQTINYLRKNGAKVILMTHLGRPQGKRVLELSTQPVGRLISKFIKKKVCFIPDCVGENVKLAVEMLKPGDVLLLENLRFYQEEYKNDNKFAKKLANLADVYVNEAFSNVHRNHASMVGVPKFLPSYAGFNLIKELAGIKKFLKQKKHPIVAVIGGVKISTKLGAIMYMLRSVDHVLLGGALANTVLAAQGVSIGKSLVEQDMIRLLQKFPLTSTKLHIPVDVLISSSIKKSKKSIIGAVGGKIAKDQYIVDIGPDTIKLYCSIIKQAKTIFFAGPMGKFEVRAFAKGTKSVLSAAKAVHGYTLAGGGDTLYAIDKFKIKSYFDYISSAGGAMLAILEGKNLLSLQLLEKK